MSCMEINYLFYEAYSLHEIISVKHTTEAKIQMPEPLVIQETHFPLPLSSEHVETDRKVYKYEESNKQNNKLVLKYS